MPVLGRNQAHVVVSQTHRRFRCVLVVARTFHKARLQLGERTGLDHRVIRLRDDLKHSACTSRRHSVVVRDRLVEAIGRVHLECKLRERLLAEPLLVDMLDEDEPRNRLARHHVGQQLGSVAKRRSLQRAEFGNCLVHYRVDVLLAGGAHLGEIELVGVGRVHDLLAAARIVDHATDRVDTISRRRLDLELGVDAIGGTVVIYVALGHEPGGLGHAQIRARARCFHEREALVVLPTHRKQHVERLELCRALGLFLLALLRLRAHLLLFEPGLAAGFGKEVAPLFGPHDVVHCEGRSGEKPKQYYKEPSVHPRLLVTVMG